ncbi:hypothetical protein JIQ42_03544 [Leishmania sp. Namibia]|uniref:hypothetical protein n=1 Tax=Leishmania sp. Namibia TaxID=2802991 RepID=UPI001B50F676|nr:hypothetical protein JIQ42_03544 [Leishmania sp. Namibia]
MRDSRGLCSSAAVTAFTLGALFALTMAEAQAELTAAVSYKLKADCPAKHLTEKNFEHDTQASGSMTSGNWRVLFVPGNDGATADRRSAGAVTVIVSFDSLVRVSTEVVSAYQAVPAHVLCDESPSLCKRFKVANSSAKLVILSGGRMYSYPAKQIRSVNDIKLFVSDFRGIESGAVPPPLPSLTVWKRLALLLGGVIGIRLVQSCALRRTSAPLPPGMTAIHPKTD